VAFVLDPICTSALEFLKWLAEEYPRFLLQFDDLFGSPNTSKPSQD
jgi:hypothetical protein